MRIILTTLLVTLLMLLGFKALASKVEDRLYKKKNIKIGTIATSNSEDFCITE